MSKKTHVKLGDNAQIFHDPTTGLKVLPNKVVELSSKQKRSKKILKALKGGHLDYCQPEEEQEEKKVDSGNDEVTVDDIPENKKDIVEFLLENFDGLDEEELKSMNKPDLLDFAKEQFEE